MVHEFLLDVKSITHTSCVLGQNLAQQDIKNRKYNIQVCVKFSGPEEKTVLIKLNPKENSGYEIKKVEEKIEIGSRALEKQQMFSSVFNATRYAQRR